MNEDESKKLVELFPLFAKQVRPLLDELRAKKLYFYLYCGYRSFEEQDKLYAQGRTAPGSRVTNARGGDSWHNYGLAVDLVLDIQPDKPGVQWSWNTKADLNADGHNDWLQMAQLALDRGFEAGYFWRSFPDLPHIQNRYGLTLMEAKELYRQESLAGVWGAIQAACYNV